MSDAAGVWVAWVEHRANWDVLGVYATRGAVRRSAATLLEQRLQAIELHLRHTAIEPGERHRSEHIATGYRALLEAAQTEKPESTTPICYEEPHDSWRFTAYHYTVNE